MATASAGAPGYLTYTSNLYAAHGAQRVVQGYAGPLFQLRRASDGAMLDVSPQSGGDYPDKAAVAAWIGSSAATVATIYDQTGGGRHLVQASAALQPAYDPGSAFGNSAVPITFASTVAAGGFNAAGPYMTGAGTWSVERTAHSMFWFAQHTQAWDNRGFAAFGNSSSGSTGWDYYSGSGKMGAVFFPTSDSQPYVSPAIGSAIKQAPRANPQAYGLTNSATAGTWYANGASVAGSNRNPVAPAQTATSFQLGRSGSQNSGSPNDFALYGLAIYNEAVSSTNAASIVAQLTTAFGGYTGAWDYNVVVDGDSISRGNTMTGIRNMPNQLLATLSKKARMYDTGTAGQMLSSSYTNRTARFPNTYLSGVPNVFFIQGGINEISTTAGTGSTLYTNVTTPFIAYLQGLGFKVCVVTLLPFGNFVTGGTQDNNRLDYNAAVVANAGGADYVLDVTQNPQVGGTVGNPAYYTDEGGKLNHPNSEGYRYLAGAPSGAYAGQYTYYTALQAMLRGATGNAGYVP